MHFTVWRHAETVIMANSPKIYSKSVRFSDICMKQQNVQRQILSGKSVGIKKFLLSKFFNTVKNLLEKHCFYEKSTDVAGCRRSNYARNIAKVSRIRLICILSIGTFRNTPKFSSEAHQLR